MHIYTHLISSEFEKIADMKYNSELPDYTGKPDSKQQSIALTLSKLYFEFNFFILYN